MAKLQHLEGLRGSAAFIVVMHHFACAFLPAAVFGGTVVANLAAEKTIYRSPLQLFVAGNFAVCIFFILSGFVLSHKFFQTKDHEVIRSSAMRRYFRLMPPIMASILLAYLLMHLGLFFNQQAARYTGSSMWLGIYWTHIPGLREALWQGLYGVIAGNSDPGVFNNVLWTMKIEFFGSFYVFAFLALFGMMRHRWLVYLIAIAFTFNSYYLAFTLGIMLSDFTSSRFSPEYLRPYLTIPLGLLGLFLGAAPIPSSVHTIYSNVQIPLLPNLDMLMLMHNLGAFFLMVALLYSPFLKKVLSTRPFRYLGRVSFSVYLLHVLVIGTVASYIFVHLVGHMHYSLAIALTFVATLTISFLAAELFTRKIDQRAIRLSGVLYKHIFDAGKPSSRHSEAMRKKVGSSDALSGRLVS